MSAIRLIARLDVKGPNLIKGVHLEGLRVLGDPHAFSRQYYAGGADELIYMDLVASLYGRSKLADIVSRVAHDVFIPMTVGGGIRNVDDVGDLLRAGADKVAVNTAAVRRPELITEIAKRFGSQCMVLSVEAKRQAGDTWEVYTDCGRERSGKDVVTWVRTAIDLGAGEVLLTSIDHEGTRRGFDTELISAVSSISSVPIIASGGYGEPGHLKPAVHAGAGALAFADAIHYSRTNFTTLRADSVRLGIKVRSL